MNTNDKKTLLMSKLSFHYLGEIHSMFELSNREVSGNAGSLCGMAAVYQAAVDTILTVFEIKTLTFDEVRNQFIVNENLFYSLKRFFISRIETP